MNEKYEKGDLIFIPADTGIWQLNGSYFTTAYPKVAIFTKYGAGEEYVVFIYNNIICYTKTSFVHKAMSKHADKIPARKGKRICLSKLLS
jgi:hypothetical protein